MQNRYVFAGRRGRRPLPTLPNFLHSNKNLSLRFYRKVNAVARCFLRINIDIKNSF